MPRYEICLQAQVRAPAARVFEAVADHEQCARLFGGRGVRVKPGSDHPNGLGSVRRIGSGRFAFDETITLFDPPRRIEYRITRGSPLKNHLGQIRLDERDGMTHLDYVIHFDAKISFMGSFLFRVLQRGWTKNAHRQLAELEAC